MRVTLHGRYHERHRTEAEARMADPAERQWIGWLHALARYTVSQHRDLAYRRRADGRWCLAVVKAPLTPRPRPLARPRSRR